jgi:hypothetical protein
MLKKFALATAVVCLLACVAGAQKLTEKDWSQWSKKETQKVLDDSPWGQTQVETDTSEMFYKPTTQGQGRGSTVAVPASAGSSDSSLPGNNRAEDGATNQATSVRFHIRWFSARPIRRALARQVSLERGGALDARLRAFADGAADQRTVVAVTFDADDQRYGNRVMQAFNSAVASTLKNGTYLERRDGARVFLAEYVPPTQNTLGAALFIFPRVVREQQFLSPDSGEVRFVSEFVKSFKLDMRFRVADMIYEGKLEY